MSDHDKGNFTFASVSTIVFVERRQRSEASLLLSYSRLPTAARLLPAVASSQLKLGKLRMRPVSLLSALSLANQRTRASAVVPLGSSPRRRSHSK